MFFLIFHKNIGEKRKRRHYVDIFMASDTQQWQTVRDNSTQPDCSVLIGLQGKFY